jgi:hypothetical protein
MSASASAQLAVGSPVATSINAGRPHVAVPGAPGQLA